MYSLGIDIGGTSIKACLYRMGEPGGGLEAVAEPLRQATPSDGSYRSMLDLLHRIIDHHRELIPSEQRNSGMQIGLGTPGLVDSRGYLRGDAVNIPGWTGVQLKDELSEYAGVEVQVANDVNMAAYAEWRLGAGTGSDSMVFISLGTGIGSGIITRGGPVAGHTGMAGEIGHLVVEPGGRQCKCGLKGCLERYSSASGIALTAQELAETGGPELDGPLRSLIQGNRIQRSRILGNPIPEQRAVSDVAPPSVAPATVDFRDVPPGASSTAQPRTQRPAGPDNPADAQGVYEALEQGDPLARAVHASSSRRLAQAAAAVAHMLNPRLIVLGGGVLAAGDVIVQGVKEHLHEFVMPMALDDLEIRRTVLGPDAGMLGAAAMAADFAGEGYSLSSS
ncbi:ROK family protein [Salinispira pacifica]|uniref:Glucokinase n=1 Tax=Salinispira pacifica TaxID=1307761 RepID=V5WLB3_9SPIO|nr:ROK family protein [Salinispira pacifica]AHC15986.1 Glucokinase [Salinispira pacifica]